MARLEHLVLIMTKNHGHTGKMTAKILMLTVALLRAVAGVAIPLNRQTAIQEVQETRKQDQATTPSEYGKEPLRQCVSIHGLYSSQGDFHHRR